MRNVRFAVVSTLMAAAVLAGTAGCSAVTTASSTGQAQADDTAELSHLLPEGIRKSGKVTVAIDPNYPPFETLSEDQKTITGLDPDLLDAMEPLLGVEFELQATGFDSIIPGLQAKRYDMAISGMTDSKSRQEQVTFVDYLSIGGALVVAADDPLAKSDDILAELCGRKVGVQTGTTTIDLGAEQDEKCAADGEPALKMSTFPTVPNAVLALDSGRIDYVWTDAISALAQVERSEGRFVSVPDHTPTYPAGIVFPKESDELTTALQSALQELIDNGTYVEIIAKYRLENEAVTTAEINGATE